MSIWSIKPRLMAPRSYIASGSNATKIAKNGARIYEMGFN